MNELLLCSFEEGAEQNCEKSLQIALTTDPTNSDALQCLANLRILRERDQEAGELLDKVMAQMFPAEGEGNPFNADFCKQTSRLLMELSRYEDCIKVLDSVVSMSEDNVSLSVVTMRIGGSVVFAGVCELFGEEVRCGTRLCEQSASALCQA
jgi:predicted O-linked N-acetylglucosamine transferase (SPINDLY family)